MNTPSKIMNTPSNSNKRYSSSSEYATPGAGVVDELENSLYYSFTADDNTINKENSINGGQWTITDVSPSTNASSRIPKAKTPLLREVLQTNFTPRNKNNKRVSFNHFIQPDGKISKSEHTNEHQTELKSNTVFDLKPIKESLPCSSIAIDQKPFDNGTDQDANSETTDLTDDFGDDMHNTIIENPSSVEQSTDLLTKVSEKSEINAFGSIEATESIETSNTTGKDAKNECEQSQLEQVLSEVVLKPHQTRNVIKLDRRRLVEEKRKSVLPVAKKTTRATTYKRRSSTYEPRKVVLSKSVSAANPKNAKPTTSTVKVVASTSQLIASGVSVLSNATSKSKNFKIGTAGRTTKPRMTMVQAPKLAVASTRQSIACSTDAKRRETKPSAGFVPTASSSSLVSSSGASVKQEFRKPNAVPLRTTKTTLVNTLKCQYCDKCFVKSQGMTTHLLEKCEKIPASVRRQLLQKAENCNEATSKQLSRQALRQEFDSISKYSRFFVNVSNEGASGMQIDEVEKGLRNLRAELRKTKNAHTGIIRTPSKPIRCHICKFVTLDCVEYADHISKH